MKSIFDLKTLIQCLYFISLPCAGSLGRSAPTLHCIAGMSVTLDCAFPTPPSEKLQDIAVWWDMENNNRTKRTLFGFENNTLTEHLEGYEVHREGLLMGDASLHLPNVNVGDEGKYTCWVFITPDNYKQAFQLEVSARPSLSLPEQATVMKGEEKTLLCDITGFYPEELEVTWKIQNGPQAAQTAVLQDVCTGVPIVNGDGTFNVSSRITVQENAMENSGALYTCEVKHRSCSGPYSKSVTLKVVAPTQLYDAAVLIATTMISSILLVSAILGGAIIYYKYFRTAPPSVSDITKPAIVYAKSPTDFKCTIRGVRQKDLKVQWYKITGLSAGNCKVSSDSAKENDPLTGEDVSDQAQLHSDGIHHVSVLSLTLSIDEDNTRYRCVVQNGNKTITRETTVSIKAQPSFLQISSLPQIPEVGKSVVLCCRIEKFYPEDICVEWSRQDGEPMRTGTQFGPFSDHERLFSVWSKTELFVTREDEGAVCTCRVYHSSFPGPQYKDVTYYINTQGTPPSVMFIKCDPIQPKVDKECTFNCCVKNFCPDSVTITWFQNEERVLSGVFNSPPSLNINGLYSMWTFLKLTLTKQDLGSVFKCLVEHSAQREPEEREFTLSNLIVAV